MIPIDMRPLHLWMGLTYPLAASMNLAMIATHFALIEPARMSLAWQAAWLDLLTDAAREDEKARKAA